MTDAPDTSSEILALDQMLPVNSRLEKDSRGWRCFLGGPGARVAHGETLEELARDVARILRGG